MKTTPRSDSRKRLLGRGPWPVATALGIAANGCILLVWFLVSWRGWIKPLYLPPPWRVLQAASDLEPNILVHALFTFSLVLVGWATGTGAGFIVGLLMRGSFVARSVLTPILESWRYVPPVALIPFFILWFGFSWWGKAVLIALGTFLIIVIGVVNSIDNLNPVYLQGALCFGGDNWKFLRWAAMPAIMPAMLAPMRIALAVAVTIAVVSEYMGATRGLGYVMNISLNSFSSHTILLCTIVIGCVGGALDWILRGCHARTVRWARVTEEACAKSA
jgi:ABC-type nitrate/sulfonate/bicarbonate transport system permease component